LQFAIERPGHLVQVLFARKAEIEEQQCHEAKRADSPILTVTIDHLLPVRYSNCHVTDSVSLSLIRRIDPHASTSTTMEIHSSLHHHDIITVLSMSFEDF
jgi:hypothetical protein